MILIQWVSKNITPIGGLVVVVGIARTASAGSAVRCSSRRYSRCYSFFLKCEKAHKPESSLNKGWEYFLV
jgi:hypothetical protein